MSDPAIQEAISKLIIKEFGDIPGSSKLSILQDIYQSNQLTTSENISASARLISKKIFGSGLVSFASHHLFKSPVPAHLTAFAHILLLISFQDQHVMSLLISEVKNSAEFLPKFSHFPFQHTGIHPLQLKHIVSQILLKMNGWRKIFTISDIMKNYYISAQVFGIFIRELLVKVGYEGSNDFSNVLDKTAEIYSILFEYFDLTVMTKSQSIPKSDRTSDIYMFPDYNLFILTCGEKEYCTGRYYDNEEDLLRSEKTVRKSTLQYIISRKNDNETEERAKLLKSQRQSRSDQEEEEYQFKVTSTQESNQFNMDFNINNSCQNSNFFAQSMDTPYFSSDQQTPQFGKQSLKFRKSIDFEGAIEQVQKNGFKKKQQTENLLGDALKKQQKQYFMNFKLNSLTINEEQEDKQHEVLRISKNLQKIEMKKGEEDDKFLFQTFEDLSPKQSEGSKKNMLFIPTGQSLQGVKQCESERPSSQENLEEQNVKKIDIKNPFSENITQHNNKFLSPPPCFDVTDPVSPSGDQSQYYFYPMKSSRSNNFLEGHKMEETRKQKYNHYHQIGDRMQEIQQYKNIRENSKSGQKFKNWVESSKKAKNNRKYSTNYNHQAEQFLKFKNIHSSSYFDQNKNQNIRTHTCKNLENNKFDYHTKSQKNIFSEQGEIRRKTPKMGLTSNTINFKIDNNQRIQGSEQNIVKIRRQAEKDFGNKYEYRHSYRVQNNNNEQNKLMMTKSMEKVEGWAKFHPQNSDKKKEQPQKNYDMREKINVKNIQSSKKGQFPQFLRRVNKQNKKQYKDIKLQKPKSPIKTFINYHRKKKSQIFAPHNASQKPKFMSPDSNITYYKKKANTNLNQEQWKNYEEKSVRNNNVPYGINSPNTKSQPDLKANGFFVNSPTCHRNQNLFHFQQNKYFGNFVRNQQNYGIPFISNPPTTENKNVYRVCQNNLTPKTNPLTASQQIQRIGRYIQDGPRISAFVENCPSGRNQVYSTHQKRQFDNVM